jgi:hypothetical protein
VNTPHYVRALLDLLRGQNPELPGDDAWRDLLALADRTQCTLFLRPTPSMPSWLEESIAQRRAANRTRRTRLNEVYQELAGSLTRGGVEFVLLKGFTHEAGFGIQGEDRVQYDLDLWCQDRDAARAILRELSYVPQGPRELSIVHDRPLVRRTGWTWRGDYYDPDMPIAVELHSTLWNGASHRLPLPETEGFWRRRVVLDACGLRVPALAETDRIAFAALHVLRHTLHHDLRLSHALELARLLDTRAAEAKLWEAWNGDHSLRSRRLQSVAFRFAGEWFGRHFPEAIEEAWNGLPAEARAWFGRFAFAPLANLLRPNKNVLWLHRELVEGWWDRHALVWSGWLPVKRPPPGRAMERVVFHTRALAAALSGAARLRRTSSRTEQTSD